MDARWTRREMALAAMAAGVSGCSQAPDLIAGERGRIVRVSDGDALALDTGQKVRLVEIEAPQPGYDRGEDQPFAEGARAMLTAAAVGRAAQLWYGGLSRDRYDRALAHAIAADETGREVWLNGLMVRQGGARVRTFPDNARRARRLLALEAEARGAKRGLWASDYWRVRGCDDLGGAPVFAVVEGEVVDVAAEAAKGEAAAEIVAGGFRLRGLAGLGKPDAGLEAATAKRLRIRGRIERDAPLIKLTHWAQVEMA